MDAVDGGMFHTQPGPRRLLQILMTMSGSQTIRLHVYDQDSPTEIAARFINFMHNMQMLHVTEPRNVSLFRDAIESFITSELQKIGFG
jgi:hypothetical protein